ncbi:hypothetical protein FA95DRAFT_371169 [Auriscalpium vulgare]|uniref:Uncharacterized protein n=1 Tax=Auriscalpium vulgare TaxID=40419 RepID=A0ACB8RIZ5_9AGAM|nr:hypothetical protein FA95DRAFT_371169 [Auriscalpium vulgare]
MCPGEEGWASRRVGEAARWRRHASRCRISVHIWSLVAWTSNADRTCYVDKRNVRRDVHDRLDSMFAPAGLEYCTLMLTDGAYKVQSFSKAVGRPHAARAWIASCLRVRAHATIIVDAGDGFRDSGGNG